MCEQHGECTCHAHASAVLSDFLMLHWLAGAKRLGHGDDAAGYWDLHIGEDLRHGKQMIEDVVVPLTEK